jgi:hypothetical protein
VAWLPHKVVKSCPYIQFKTIYSTTLPYSSSIQSFRFPRDNVCFIYLLAEEYDRHMAGKRHNERLQAYIVDGMGITHNTG